MNLLNMKGSSDSLQRKTSTPHFYIKQVLKKDLNMETKTGNTKEEKVQTTIGDLIEAIMQVATEAGKSQEEGYRLTAATLESILNRKRTRSSLLH